MTPPESVIPWSSDSPSAANGLRMDRPLTNSDQAIQIGELRVSPPILQAPMAGYTNYAFRQMVRAYGGVGLLATEMVNANSFMWMDRIHREHPDRLWGVRTEPRPLAVQMWDNDPVRLAEVGSRLATEYGVSVVDLNFGCPVKQVTERAHSGSYLLRDPQRMGEIIERVVRACGSTPVTAKIRLGGCRKTMNPVEIAQVVEGAGAAALTVHGRTAADHFRGRADWDQIAAIKPYLRRIPLIGNGDLDSPQKAAHAFAHYGVDGVMIARACLGRPWIFQQTAALLRGEPLPPDPSLAQQRSCLLEHYARVVERFGEERGTLLMRKFACCYAQGLVGSRRFRAVVAVVVTRSDFLAALSTHFPTDA